MWTCATRHTLRLKPYHTTINPILTLTLILTRTLPLPMHYLSSTSNDSSALGMGVYATDLQHHEDNLVGLCDDDVKSVRDNNPWASKIDLVKWESQYKGREHVVDPEVGLNGTYYHWAIHIMLPYRVEVSWSLVQRT